MINIDDFTGIYEIPTSDLDEARMAAIIESVERDMFIDLMGEDAYLRLMAVMDVGDSDLTEYLAALASVTEDDYPPDNWAEYQSIIKWITVTALNSQDEVDAATEDVIVIQTILPIDLNKGFDFTTWNLDAINGGSVTSNSITKIENFTPLIILNNSFFVPNISYRIILEGTTGMAFYVRFSNPFSPINQIAVDIGHFNVSVPIIPLQSFIFITVEGIDNFGTITFDKFQLYAL